MIKPYAVCGVDEVGRGPLAGPVVAAAVILDPALPIAGLADSKVLDQATREELAEQVRARALAVAVAEASVAEIDSLNILHASMLAMQRAMLEVRQQLGRVPSLSMIDGNRCPDLPWPMQAVVKGDARVQSIAAASIVAKVARDQLMTRLDIQFPGYGFAAHKGYPTPFHQRALECKGVCVEHRRSFAPVRRLLAPGSR